MSDAPAKAFATFPALNGKHIVDIYLIESIVSEKAHPRHAMIYTAHRSYAVYCDNLDQLEQPDAASVVLSTIAFTAAAAAGADNGGEYDDAGAAVAEPAGDGWTGNE